MNCFRLCGPPQNRGLCWCVSVLLAAWALATPASATEILALRWWNGNPVTASEPISGPIQFAVVAPGGSTGASFTITPPGQSPFGGGGISGYAGSVRYFFTYPMCTNSYRNGIWTVSCTIYMGGGNNQSAGPAEFEMKNLTVLAVHVTNTNGQDPAVEPAQDPIFVSVATAWSSFDWRMLLRDGLEVNSAGSWDTQETDVVFLLYPLPGSQLEFEDSSHVGPDDTPVDGSGTTVQPGLYYKGATATDEPQPVGPADAADFYWSPLRIETVTKKDWVSEGTRQGHWTLNVKTSDTPSSSAITGADYAWRKPDGSASFCQSADPDDFPPDSANLPSEPYTVNGSSTTFALAGTYILGMSYQDSHSEPHDPSINGWSPARHVTFDVPAAAHFAGSGWTPAEGNCEFAYGLLGSVTSSAPTRPVSFYSARPDDHVRGGVVPPSAANRRANFLSALRQDEIIHWSGHSTYDFAWDEEAEEWKIMKGIQPSPGDEVIWACEIGGLAREPQGKPKARLVYLDACELLASTTGYAWENGQWVAYPLQGPVFAEEVKDHLASAVVAHTHRTCEDSSAEFNEEFWPLLTEDEYTIAEAVAGALNALYERHDRSDQWMVDHHLWESADPVVPGVKAIGSGKDSTVTPAF